MKTRSFLRAILMLFVFAILQALPSPPANAGQAAPLVDYRYLGETQLPYGENFQTVLIEDASPDYDSTAESQATHYASTWGMVGSLSAGGAQVALSAASHYTSPNLSATVEHIAAIDPDGNVISFYYSEDNDWKAVNVSEKTGVQVAVERPTSWTAQAGSTLLENIAARQTGGKVHVFTWHADSDWQAANLSSSLGYYAVSPLTSWNAPAGQTVAEHVAFRTQDSDLVLFWRYAGGTWAAVNVSGLTGKKVAGTPSAWDMTTDTSKELIAITDSNQHLLLFTFTPSTNWNFEDVSAQTGNVLVEGRVVAWDSDGFQHIAAHTPSDHLVVFTFDSIESQWSVADLTAQTGKTIYTPPALWLSTQGSETTVVHMAASGGANNHILHFSAPSGSSAWAVEDVSQKTGVTTPIAPDGWWTERSGVSVQRIAAPTGDGRMQVFSKLGSADWSALDVSQRSAGRVVYTASPLAGVWVSRDYGANWAQSTRPQPAVGAEDVPGALLSGQILDVAVSPEDYNLVFAAADRELRQNATSGAGVYRSQGGGDMWQLVHQFSCSWGVEAAAQIVIAPDDPQRIYAAGGCAIARSENGGGSWTELHPTTNQKQRIWHLAVSGKTGPNPQDRVIVACGNGALWVSKDDGAHWSNDPGAASDLPSGFCGKTTGHSQAAQVLALAPSDPGTVYLAMDYASNGPSYYHPQSHGEGPDGTFCNSPVIYDADDSKTYNTGDSVIFGFKPALGGPLGNDAKLKFRDLDGDNLLDANEGVVYDYNANGIYDVNQNGIDKAGETVYRKGNALNNNDALKYDAKLRYLNRGRPFGTRQCGEGSLWLGKISDVIAQVGQKSGVWVQVPGPPLYYGANTPSGATYVYTHPQPAGYLVFFSDQGTVHVATGEPAVDGWHRLDGTDISEDHRQGRSSTINYMHVDPQGITVSPDFQLELKPVTDQPFPYNQNSELKTCGGGRIWLAHDGGVETSDDCGATDLRWRATFSGLHTLAAYNILGATDLDLQPKLYFGVADDDDFFSPDDGHTWKTAYGACGDCDTWFGDLFQLERVLRIEPRSNNGNGAFGLFTSQTKTAPDASLNSLLYRANYPSGVRPYAISSYVIRGYRPVIQSLPQETPPPDSDYITIQAKEANKHLVLRANNNLSKGGTSFVQVGPQIPALPVNQVPKERPLWVQAAGGHSDPYFYVGDGKHLWRARSASTTWADLPTGGDFTEFWRFFSNPYDPSILYAITNGGLFRSEDYGDSWQRDDSLQAALSDNGDWRIACWDDNCLLNDMIFEPGAPNRRFATGVAGVFFSVDGVEWVRLLDTRAIPCRPRGLWFDSISRTGDDALYVACFGRGILRLHPIPALQPSPLPPAPAPPPIPTPSPTPVPPGSGKNILANGGFESQWKLWSTGGSPELDMDLVHGGNLSARLGNTDDSQDEVGQTLELPCEARQVVLRYFTYISSGDTVPSLDTLQVSVESAGTLIDIQRLTEESIQGRWIESAFDLSDFRCAPLHLTFHSILNDEGPTNFYIDDVQLLVYDGNYYQNLPVVHK